MRTVPKTIDKTSEMAVLDIDVAFTLSVDAVAELDRKYMPLTVDGIQDKVGLAVAKEAWHDVRGKRVDVDKRRLELKRKIDEVGNDLVGKLRAIEGHLKGQIDAVENAKKRIKREAEEAKRKKIEDRMNQLHLVECRTPTVQVECMTDDEFAKELAEATATHKTRETEKAEEERLRNEETQRLKAEAEKLAAEREKLEAEAARIEELKRELEQREAEEAECAKQEEAERIEKEAADKERREEKAERQEELIPSVTDMAKLLNVAIEVSEIEVPEVSDDLAETVDAIKDSLAQCALEITDSIRSASSACKQSEKGE